MINKIVARNKKTGSNYTYCRRTPHGNYYAVSTRPGAGQWLVGADDVIILKGREKFKKTNGKDS